MAVADRFRLVWTPFLRKERRQVLQAVGLSFPAVPDPDAELSLQVGSRNIWVRASDLIAYPCQAEGAGELPAYLWLVPRPAKPVRCRAAWKMPSGRVERAELTLRPADPVRIHVAFTADAAGQTLPVERLLSALDATATRPAGTGCTWTLDPGLLERSIETARSKPQVLRRLEQRIREGSIAWGLAPSIAHSEFYGFEEMCRSTYAARRLAERFGVAMPRAARMIGAPAHTASLGMALTAAGGTLLQIAADPALRPLVPPVFWWKLPDGSRILVNYRGACGVQLLPPESWPWREWLAVQDIGDNAGPALLGTLEHLDWIKRQFDWPVCRVGRLEDFGDAIARRHGKKLPVVDKELTDWSVAGIAGQVRATASVRRDKDRLVSAETVSTLAAWESGKPAEKTVGQEIREGFRTLAWYTGSTPGIGAGDPGQAPPEGNLCASPLVGVDAPGPSLDGRTASWQDKAGLAQTARRIVEHVEAGSLSTFAQQLAGGERRRGAAGSDRSVVLFNTLSWPRGGVVRIGGDKLPAGEFELVDASTGGAVPYERSEGGIEFVAPAVPACGHLVLEIRRCVHRGHAGRPADWEDRKLTLHTPETTLQFHTAGGMSRWHDRRHSVQWCSGMADYPTGAYLYEMPGSDRLKAFASRVRTDSADATADLLSGQDEAALQQFGPLPGGNARVYPEITPLYSRVVAEGGIPARRPPGRRSGDARRYRLIYTLYHSRPELYVNLRLFEKSATNAPEAGYAFFPFAIEKPYVLVDRIAHLTTPEDDLAAGANAGQMVAHHGVRIEGDHAGMNFYPLDTPLVSFNSPGAYLYNEHGAYPNGTIYAMLFNSGLGMYPAQGQSGDLSFDFVLHPTGSDGWDGGLSKGGMEQFRPLLAAVVPGRPGKAAASLLKIEPSAVQLVALKPADFEPGYVLRIWNSLLDPAEACLTFPAARRGDELWQCDLVERSARRVAVSLEGEARLKLRPHEIATLLLRPER